MKDYMKTIINSVQEWTNKKIKDSTADWNQNDSSADNYIKNRTHWTEMVKEVFFEEQTIEGFTVLQEQIYAVSNVLNFEPIVGTTYTVIWDGIEYSVACELDNNLGLIYFGNKNYVTMMSGGNIPFCVIFSHDDVSSMNFIATESTDSSHVIEIYKQDTVVHKLNEKYLPDTVAMVKDVSTVADLKMDAENPVGTGSFSMNRKDDTTIGDYSVAEGRNTTASTSASHAEGHNTVVTSDKTIAPDPLDKGSNVWYLTKGFASHAEGYGTVVSGYSSHAEGNGSNASGDASHAEGYSTVVSGFASHAEGNGSNASGDASHAEGSGTNASGTASHAEGGSTTASGMYSHAEGVNTIASGYYGSHAEGSVTKAYGNYSHAEGHDTTASGSMSHAEGVMTTATGNYSHAEGRFTTSSGETSHAEGYKTLAFAYYSHAEGYENLAMTQYQHVQGKYNKYEDIDRYIVKYGTYIMDIPTEEFLSGDSYTIDMDTGYITITNPITTTEPVVGKYILLDTTKNGNTDTVYEITSITDTKLNVKTYYTSINDILGKYAHIVGNGTAKNKRSNAHTLAWDGTAEYQGDVIAYGCESGQTPISLKELDKTKTMIVTISEVYPETASEDPEVAPLLISPSYVADKTFDEIYQHVTNGGYALVKINTNFYGSRPSYFNLEYISESEILFSCTSMTTPMDTYSGVSHNSIFKFLVMITSDNVVNIISQTYDLTETQEGRLNTTDKTVVGAINELLATITNLQTDIETLKNNQATYDEETENLTIGG